MKKECKYCNVLFIIKPKQIFCTKVCASRSREKQPKRILYKLNFGKSRNTLPIKVIKPNKELKKKRYLMLFEAKQKESVNFDKLNKTLEFAKSLKGDEKAFGKWTTYLGKLK